MTFLPPSPARRVLLGIGLLALIGCAGWGIDRYFHDLTLFPPDDFVEYWSAGRLNAFGENPYDPALLQPLQKEMGRDESKAVMMWNPPWTLTLVMPFGLLPPRLAQLLWQLMSLALIVVSSDWLWRIYDGPPQRRWIAWLLALTFMPTIFVIRAGQIGAFIVFGSVAFLGLIKQGHAFAAGGAAVALAVKPHLLYLVWIVLLIRSLAYQRRLLWGGLVVGLVASLIPWASHPAVYRDYWEAMTHRAPVEWESPTLGTVLRLLTDADRFHLQFVPTALGLIVLLVWRRYSCDRDWNWLNAYPALGLMSFVTASYGAWPFDLVLLLPALIQRACRIDREGSRREAMSAILVYCAINAAALALNLLRIDSFWFIGMAPALLAAYGWFGTPTIHKPRALVGIHKEIDSTPKL